ncbi:peptidase [Streptomyces sp. NBC_00555]|uniref:peptidase n=1 Tax=Streptomyces sp. NBC_00555 TaxID=2903662 RepID=UPI002256B807|nr:peptidase [Streptomyces sp. NBC_00555]MCX5012228.1 peptidase [Streptomyces sp. NBC_00555]
MRKRISLLAAAGLAAVGLAAAPANAADPVFTLTSPAEVGLRPHPGQSGQPKKTSVEFRVENETGSVFDRLSTFTIDLSPLKGVADVALTKDRGGDCTLVAAKVTCKDWAIWTHGSNVVSLDLTAAKDSAVGTVADLTMTGTADGATFKPATTKVKVGGPDLVLGPAALKAKLTPGETQPLPIVFTNAGTESVNGVALEVNTTHGIGLVEKYDNCSYSKNDTPGRPWNAGWGTTVCVLDGEYKPGTVYEVKSALTLKAEPHAFIDGMTYAVHAAGAQPKTSQKQERPSTGKKLTVVEREAKAGPLSADIDPSDNQHEFDFQTKNTADFVARAVSLKGKAGETVKADFGFENKGPAWVAYLRSGEDVARTDIVIPQGAKVTKAPEQCSGVNADGSYREQKLGAPRYFCGTTHIVGETEKVSYPFELKIEKVVADSTGSISVGQWTADGTKPQDWDPSHANNKAAFVINAKDGGTTPTPGPTTTGTPAPTGSATPSATPSAGASTSASTAATAQGGLANTGVTAGPLLIAGAALVAAGGAVFLAFRRRATGRA